MLLGKWAQPPADLQAHAVPVTIATILLLFGNLTSCFYNLPKEKVPPGVGGAALSLCRGGWDLDVRGLGCSLVGRSQPPVARAVITGNVGKPTLDLGSFHSQKSI